MIICHGPAIDWSEGHATDPQRAPATRPEEAQHMQCQFDLLAAVTLPNQQTVEWQGQPSALEMQTGVYFSVNYPNLQPQA